MSAPQNRLRSGEDRRTHRSAPTKGYTYHRYTSSASVPIKARRVTRCRDARSERPLYQRLQRQGFNGDGRPPTRHSRASLQIGVTAFDEWNCRADVACVGADLVSARRIDCAQVRTGGHTDPPLRWVLPPRRAVHPKRSRPSLRNEKNFAFYLHMNLESRVPSL